MPMRMLRVTAYWLGVGLTALVLLQGPLGAKDRLALVGPKVEEFTLKNGMRFVLIADPTSTTVVHAIWYQVGSADEPKGKSGLAHFLEHLMYQGTAKNGPYAYGDMVSADGAFYNAFTSNDMTVYHVRVPKPLLSRVMDLEADRMRNLKIDEQRLQNERLVIQEERRLRLDSQPEAILLESMEAEQLRNHPYGVTTAGLMSDIAALTSADVQAFYDLHYHPENAITVVAGNLELEELKALAEFNFADIPRGPDRKRIQSVLLPDKLTTKLIEQSSETAQRPILTQSYVVPAYGQQNKDEAFAISVLATILASGTQGRLVKSLVLDSKTALDVDVNYDGFKRLGGTFAIRASIIDGATTEAVEKTFFETLADIRENGVTQAEVDTALKRAEISSVYTWDSQSSIAYEVGSKLTVGWTVDKALTLDGWSSVTPEAVQAAAKRYLTPERALTGILRPKTGN
jgi:zinc protease